MIAYFEGTVKICAKYEKENNNQRAFIIVELIGFGTINFC